MSENKEKILITSALIYVNGMPHLGHMIGCLLPADVFARFKRQQGKDVLYICGTDEHGTPTEIAAIKEGLDFEDYCLKLHEKHKAIYEGFNLSFDHFGRTSKPNNHNLTKYIALRLQENGYMEEKTTKQVYSIDDERFLPDRYVSGTCPYCGYEKARGDQCENCTKLLDPADLLNPYASISKSTNLEIRESKHLFLRLDKIQDKVASWVKEKNWDKMTVSIANKWLKEGLQARCISRDLSWGVKIEPPKENPITKEFIEVDSNLWKELDKKVFYVWFDAPIGYIGITMDWADENEIDWKEWWYDNDENVKYYEFVGKDNVPFHSVFFPAMLIGSEEPFKKVDVLKGMSWLNFEGGKFSKSDKRGIFCEDAIKEFPADYWRYWLTANAPESDDTNFTFEGFAALINKDLNDVFGNFIMRVLKFCNSKFGNVVPEFSGEFTLSDKELIDNLQQKFDNYTDFLEKLEYRKALTELRAFWVLGNNYINQSEPWKIIKENEKRAKDIIYISINLICVFALAAKPIIPEYADIILNLFNRNDDNNIWPKNIKEAISFFNFKDEFTVPEKVFVKIEPEQVEELKEKYKA